jgi:hypothetical protein
VPDVDLVRGEIDGLKRGLLRQGRAHGKRTRDKRGGGKRQNGRGRARKARHAPLIYRCFGEA